EERSRNETVNGLCLTEVIPENKVVESRLAGKAKGRPHCKPRGAGAVGPHNLDGLPVLLLLARKERFPELLGDEVRELWADDRVLRGINEPGLPLLTLEHEIFRRSYI